MRAANSTHRNLLDTVVLIERWRLVEALTIARTLKFSSWLALSGVVTDQCAGGIFWSFLCNELRDNGLAEYTCTNEAGNTSQGRRMISSFEVVKHIRKS